MRILLLFSSLLFFAATVLHGATARATDDVDAGPLADAMSRDGRFDSTNSPSCSFSLDDAVSEDHKSPITVPFFVEQVTEYQPVFLRWKLAIEDLLSRSQPLVNFWDHARTLGAALEHFVREMLRQAGDIYHTDKFDEVRVSMEKLVNGTAVLRATLELHNVTADALSEELQDIFQVILDELQEAFPSPEKAPSHDQRKVIVAHVLDRVEIALMDLGVRHGVDEQVIRGHFSVIRRPIEAITVTVGDLSEQHPDLVAMLMFSVAVMLIPEYWLLRPFLSIFGFGPTGPVKGSAAAWMQRRFWGAAVKKGSWFSFLQWAGMKSSFTVGVWKKIIVGVGVGAGVAFAPVFALL
ncbi:hypothetical protein F5I97DRAFT_962065 [Phlebopus sp. FC_14]|nr:hypothetical protein F5I97DRAFT_962065 [Phlebopus sp. FC_14]